MEKNALALDFGASSGRAILGGFDGNKITLTEVHRFDNNPVKLRDTLYWDVLHLFFELKQGLHRAAACAPYDSVGIDTWGVDFGLLDPNGHLLQNPVHYLDARTAGLPEEVAALLAPDTVYRRTGIQVMELNTLFQLYSLVKNNPKLLQTAQTLLLMPDLFGYLLTGNRAAEYSIASTTGMLDPATRQWNIKMLEKLQIPARLLPEIVKSGTPLGMVSPAICEELGLAGAQVISVTGHDTASAVAAVPAGEDDFIYISCGTWSLFGTELQSPMINEKSQRYNITNEGGFNHSVRFHKNIIGLWLIQETRRQYRREGKEYSYGDLETQALQAEPFRYLIDPDDPSFAAPGNVPRRIADACAKTGQGTPQSVGEIVRCIYESIALKYRHSLAQIQDCTGKTYRTINIVGGGTKDRLLCQMTADATALPVLAGPIEATALGNIAVQLISQGVIPDLKAARQVIRNSFTPGSYSPKETRPWDLAYARFCKLYSQKEAFHA